jgi:hypothetical protein
MRWYREWSLRRTTQDPILTVIDILSAQILFGFDLGNTLLFASLELSWDGDDSGCMPLAASVMKPKSSIAGITGSKKRQMIPHKHPRVFVKSKNVEENKRSWEDEAKA